MTNNIPPLHTGPWKLSQPKVKHGLKVFSCFCCGGGSTFGYKLAGFQSVGGVEIDPQMSRIYTRNHMPPPEEQWELFKVPIQEFKKDIPWWLSEIDVLDGSPPCSSFSMAGSREGAWGKEKKFREGQANQVLDDLFFHFIEVAHILRPKIVVAENVKGLVMGNARGYVKQIFSKLSEAGYDTQLFLLNASRMGVPQARKRTFFISRRRDLKIPRLKLEFNEAVIPVSEAIRGCKGDGKPLTDKARNLWRKTMPGDSFAKANNGSWFNWIRLHPNQPSNTLLATCMLCHPDEPRFLSDSEAVRIQSFPDDYDFLDADTRYVCGMSVPPLMMQRVATEVARALLSMPGRVVRRPKL